MSRHMSVAHTEQQVVDRIKTETRRIGWLFVKPGDRLTLVRKSMGRSRADGTVEPLVRLAEVEVTAVHRQPLNAISREGCIAEGFPEMRPHEFVDFFVRTFKVDRHIEVTVIKWRYLDNESEGGSELMAERRRPMVYLAGPYTGDVVGNVRRVVQVADSMMVAGLVPVVPHLSMLWDLISPKSYEQWIAYDLEVLARCDHLYRLPGESPGADREVARARELAIPVWGPGDLNGFILAAGGHRG